MGFGRISFRSNSTFISIHSKIMGGFYTDNFGNLLRTDARIKEDLSNSLTGYYTDNTVDAYTIFGIDCQYEYKNVSIGIAALRLKLQAINIFDTLYASGGEGKEFFPGQRRTIIFGAEIDF
jgi:outer membrane receptor for Fe3+-dicitrate